MKLTNGGKALVVGFAVALVAMGAWASTRQAAPAVQAPPVLPTVIDHAAARRTLVLSAEGVEAMDAEIAATESALAIAREEASSRIISRKDDRDRVAELNRQLAEAKARRAQAVRDYNAAVAAADSSVVAGLRTFHQATGSGP